MRLRPLVFIARRHLAHDTFRTSVSVGGVALGVTFMIMLSALMTGFESKFIDETIESSPHVTIYDEPRGGTDDLAGFASKELGGAVEVARARPRERVYRIKKPLEILEAVRSNERVSAAALNVLGEAILSFGSRESGADIVGIDPDNQEAVVATNKYLQDGALRDLRSAGGAIILGAGLALELGVKKGDTIGVRLRSGATRALRVVAIYKTGITTVDSSRCYTLLALAQQILGTGRDVNRIVARLKDPEDAPDVAADIERLVGYKTESWQEANSNFLAIFVVQHTISYVVTGGIMIVAAFGILNVLIMLVMEKYPEIAMLKSMGYTASDITLVFLMEGLTIGVLGVVAGSALGYHLIEVLASLPLPQKGLLTSEHLVMANAPHLYLIAGGAALVSTALASALPALRAGKLDPVETLRGKA